MELSIINSIMYFVCVNFLSCWPRWLHFRARQSVDTKCEPSNYVHQKAQQLSDDPFYAFWRGDLDSRSYLCIITTHFLTN